MNDGHITQLLGSANDPFQLMVMNCFSLENGHMFFSRNVRLQGILHRQRVGFSYQWN